MMTLGSNKKTNNTVENNTVQNSTPEEYNPGYYDDDEDKELTNKVMNSANPLQDILDFFSQKNSK